MAIVKVGGYSIPRYDFSTALENIEVLVNDFNGEIKNHDNFAQAIGHSTSNSGAYSRKRGDLKKFGLVDSNWNATELAQRLVHPKNDREEKEAKFEALQNIELLSKLYDYTNGGNPGDEFWIKISEVADTTPAKAKDADDKVESLYREMLDYETDERSESKVEAEPDSSNIGQYSDSDDFELRMIDSEGNKFDVKEERDVEVAKAFFERALKEIKQGEEE
jgi:hypothetical protein